MRFGAGHARARRERLLGVLAILSVAAALAYLVQGVYSGSLAQYALVKALANGTATIDQTRFETGTETTVDLSYFEGHYYAAKAPGLAFATVPAYLALDGAGVRTTGDPNLMLWALGLVGVVLPLTLLLFLVRSVGERIEPGFGTAAAVTLGLGTVLTPFATVFYPHALSAFLVFASFALLFFARRRQSALVFVALAGIALGYAITTEYVHALAAPVLGIYACQRPEWLRRGITFAAGVLVGVTPLLLYNWWAFGSVTHHSYSQVGESGQVMNSVEALGVPSFAGTVSLLLTRWGLLTTAPVLLAAVVGVLLLYRRGWKAEAAVIAVIALAYPIFASATVDPFGSVPPGPRHLIHLLPFLALPLALAFRAFPLPTFALAAGSIAVAVAITAARPLEAWNGRVLERLTSRGFEDYSLTIADQFVVVGWYRMLPFFGAILLALGIALLVTPLAPFSRRGISAAGLALAGWALVATLSTRILGSDSLGADVGALVLVLLVVVLVLIVAAVTRASAAENSFGSATLEGR